MRCHAVRRFFAAMRDNARSLRSVTAAPTAFEIICSRDRISAALGSLSGGQKVGISRKKSITSRSQEEEERRAVSGAFFRNIANKPRSAKKSDAEDQIAEKARVCSQLQLRLLREHSALAQAYCGVAPCAQRRNSRSGEGVCAQWRA